MEGASRRRRSTNLRWRRQRNRKNARWRWSTFLVGENGTAFQSYQLGRSKTLSQRGGIGGSRKMRSGEMLERSIDRRRCLDRRRVREDRQRNQRAPPRRIRRS